MSPFSARCLKPLQRLSLAIACVFAGTALAQATPLLANQNGETQVLPVWNASSGQMEALLLLSSDKNSDNPLDRLFPRNSATANNFGSGKGRKGQLRGVLQPDAHAGLALLCNQGIHVAMALGSLGQECLLTQVSMESDPLLSSINNPTMTLDAHWQSADGGMDLSFGLSWLNASLRNTESTQLSGFTTTSTSVAALPRLMPTAYGGINMRQIHVSGSFPVGQQHWWSLGGSMSSQEVTLLAGQPVRWDSTAITVGVGYRNLSGFLTGRLIELPQGKGTVSGVDLGFSWRTPWQGELSFGAKNLLNQTPDTSTWPLTELPELEVPGGRTPYVRYKQDL